MSIVGGSLIVRDIGRLATNRLDAPADDLLGVMEGAAVAIVDGVVAWVGRDDDIPSIHAGLEPFDAGGRCVVPGFVDSHTHAVFAGDRADEFAMRMAGASYEEILAGGGGIHATVAATRSATLEGLISASIPRIERMLRTGTTTVEIKTGYGLDVATERRMVDAILAISRRSPIDVVPTFLGAHVVPNDHAGRRGAYLDLVTGPMLDAVGADVRFVDVFCDEAAFSVDETRSVVAAARRRGLATRLHVDQLGHSGGTALAAELGATSADHVDHASDADLAALAAADVVATLLPGVSFTMRLDPPPFRRVWDAGVTVAIATDCNPGTSYVETMPFVIALAVIEGGLTVEEAVWAATRGGALALGMDDRGVIAPGHVGDLVVLDAPSPAHLAYRPDGEPIMSVIKSGRPL